MYESIEQIRDHQDDANKIIKLATQGAFKGVVWNRLANMTDLIGSRLCGSDSLADAVAYMIDALTEEGLDNVHGEKTMEPVWTRGNEYATLHSPRKRPYKLSMLGIGGSSGSGGKPIIAEAIVVHSAQELMNRTDVKGKIVVWNPYCDWAAQPIGCYGTVVQFRSMGAIWAAKAGAVASLARSAASFSLKSPHAGMGQDGGIPAADLAVEDVDMLQRFQDRGQKITIEIYMEASTSAPRVGYNVVAEIKGSTKPDEVVLVSGHLDSWDASSNGVMDDGGGAFISWAVLSLMKLAGLRAQRTMRLVLWSCEEFGGLGGDTYWNDHKSEIDNMDMVMESDLGTFTPWGLELTVNDNRSFAMVTEVGQLLTSINSSVVVGAGEGTDINNWLEAGVPSASLLNDNSKYFYYHHSAADMMNVYTPEQLDLCAATWAVYAYVVADLDAMLPRNITMPTQPKKVSVAFE